MRARMLALAAGMLILVALPTLPSTSLLLTSALIGVLALWRKYVCLGLFLLGFCWACCNAQWALEDRLNPRFDGQTVWLTGVVEGLPEVKEGVTRFYLVDAYSRRGELPKRMRLSWYHAPSMIAGETWRVAVKLRTPDGSVNPQSFDYSAWLLGKRVGATGTVKAGEKKAGASVLASARNNLRQHILQTSAHEREGAVAALVIGDGSGLSQSDWRVLRDTGTVHLLVISGQHVSLLALSVYALIALVARLGLWPAAVPWLPWACALALCSAIGYGLLAGMEVPVQRACLMVALMLLWRLKYRHVPITTPLLVALVVVLLVEPLVVLQAGFWLSFIAVFVLIWVFAQRLGPWHPLKAWWWAQWCMAIALLPALIALGLPISFTAPIANLVAVPWVSLVSVPLSLLGTVLLPIPALGETLVGLAGLSLKVLFYFLELLSEWRPAYLPSYVPAIFWLLGALGALVALAPAGVPIRFLGVCLMLPMLFPPEQKPVLGHAEVWVLDVGQGLSVLVRTHRHALLYDAGPKRGEFDSAERMIIPSLAYLNVRALDTLLISHADSDHAGGTAAVLSNMPVNNRISGEPKRLGMGFGKCMAERWEWDQVRFQTYQWAEANDSNQRSCVLMVEANGERLLLTGDIDTHAERWLTEQGDMAAHWLLAPHHGSRSSSSIKLLEAVAPKAVLISRGKHNNFNHPHPWVIRRYEKIAAEIYDTALEGAVTIKLGAFEDGQRLKRSPRFWR